MKVVRRLPPMGLKRSTALDFKFEGKFTVVKLVVITVQDFLYFTKLIDLAGLSADFTVPINLLNLPGLSTIKQFIYQQPIAYLFNLTKFSQFIEKSDLIRQQLVQEKSPLC